MKDLKLKNKIFSGAFPKIGTVPEVFLPKA